MTSSAILSIRFVSLAALLCRLSSDIFVAGLSTWIVQVSFERTWYLPESDRLQSGYCVGGRQWWDLKAVFDPEAWESEGLSVAEFQTQSNLAPLKILSKWSRVWNDSNAFSSKNWLRWYYVSLRASKWVCPTIRVPIPCNGFSSSLSALSNGHKLRKPHIWTNRNPHCGHFKSIVHGWNLYFW